MKTRITINWNVVIVILIMLWMGWVSISLSDTIARHEQINRRLDNYGSDLSFAEDRINEIIGRERDKLRGDPK